WIDLVKHLLGAPDQLAVSEQLPGSPGARQKIRKPVTAHRISSDHYRGPEDDLAVQQVVGKVSRPVYERVVAAFPVAVTEHERVVPIGASERAGPDEGRDRASLRVAALILDVAPCRHPDRAGAEQRAQHDVCVLHCYSLFRPKYS